MKYLKNSSFYILLILVLLSSFIGLWIWLSYTILLTIVCIVIISIIKKKYPNIDYDEAFNRGFLFTIVVLFITLPPYFITISKIKNSIPRYTKIEETKSIKIRHQKHKYYSDNTTCTNCNIGKYVNGICTICGTASDELVKEHTDEYDEILRETNDYTCPHCEGNGCKKCKFKGIITPY